MAFPPDAAGEAYCYLTTRGRVSGQPREIEIWFGLEGTTLYMLAGGRERADWVRNLVRESRVSVRIGGESRDGTARVVEDAGEDTRARELVAAKYDMRGSSWERDALPVAVDFE